MKSNVVDPGGSRNGDRDFGHHNFRSGESQSGMALQDVRWSAVTPADLARSVIGHWPSIIFTTLLVMVLTVGLLAVWPNRYGSDGMLYVRLGRAALSVDPTAQNAGAGVSVQETRSAEVQSVADMIGSREIAERAVNEVGVDRILQPHSWVDQTVIELERLTAGSSAYQSREHIDQLRREEAIKRVRKWLSVDVPKNGYTIAVTLVGPDPFLVQSITESVLSQYKNYHVEAHRNDGSLEFFEQQVNNSREVATRTRETLQQARSEAGWTSVQSAETTLRERIVALEVGLDSSLSELAEATQRRDSLGQQLASTREWIPMEVTRGVANAASDSMKTQLFDQQVDESEQLATLKPEHPRFRLLQEKMTRSQGIVEDEANERELRREALNPLWQQLESEYSLASAKTDGLRHKTESLNERLQLAQKELLKLNSNAVKIARLKWEADIAEESLLDHARSLEEARIISELDRNKMSDVTIIQNASLNLKKVSPSRIMLGLVGLLLGMALGVFQAILRHPIEQVAYQSSANDSTFDLAEEQHETADDFVDIDSVQKNQIPAPALPR
ncbi:exopolysaccharide biosynthesis protein [Stieleria sp. JC731]|uniref:GumC family protein n=1 Tax=Pirellulaceae TaxID=2691357 RepID=UPI001E63A7E8|nr:exopolysaccharide biosynthesis protein [Stieleria sp. JC731]MCC9604075.1 exopolysaccharide biosynthesis protein [Stieleria sp. JC731]